MENIKIERLNPKDIKLIYEFFKFVIKDTFEKDGLGDLAEEISLEVEEKKKYLNQDIESNGADHFFLIAKGGSKIIGTIEYSPKDEFITSCTNGELKHLVKVGTIYIHPAHQRKGLGGRMINLMGQELKKNNIREFCLDSGFKNAQKIWIHKFGNPEYHLKDFWDDGGDHMIWRVKTEDVIN